MKKNCLIVLSVIFFSCSNNPNYFHIENNSSEQISFFYEYNKDEVFTLSPHETTTIKAKAPKSTYSIKSVNLPYSVRMIENYGYYVGFENKVKTTYKLYNICPDEEIHVFYTDLNGSTKNTTIPSAEKTDTDVPYIHYITISSYDSYSAFFIDSNSNKQNAKDFVLERKL